MAMKFKKISADEARALRKDHVREGANGAVMMRASTFKAPPSWDPEKRTARFTMTSESVDRYGDIVGQAGMDITRFMENPQGLVFHNSRSWPIGNWSDVTKNLTGRPKRTEGTLNFLPEGIEEDADRAARHVANKSIRTVSIGFRPDWDQIELITDEEDEYVTGLKFNASELLECSLVPIPANPDALVRDAAGDWRLAKETIENILDNWTRSPEGLLLPRADFEAAYRSIAVPVTFDGTKISAEARAVIKNAFKAIETEELGLELDVEEITPTAEEAAAEPKAEEDMPDDPECAEEDKAAGDVGTVFKAPTQETMLAFVKDALPTDTIVRVVSVAGFRSYDLQIQRDGQKIAGLMVGNDEKRIDDVVELAVGMINMAADERANVDVVKTLEDFIAGRRGEMKTFKAAGDDVVVTPAEPEKKSIEMAVEIDTAGIEKATEKVTALGALIDSVMTKMATLFGRKSVDPVVEPAPLAAPTPEEMAEARARADALRQRLIAEGLIEA